MYSYQNCYLPRVMSTVKFENIPRMKRAGPLFPKYFIGACVQKIQALPAILIMIKGVVGHDVGKKHLRLVLCSYARENCEQSR